MGIFFAIYMAASLIGAFLYAFFHTPDNKPWLKRQPWESRQQYEERMKYIQEELAKREQKNSQSSEPRSH